MFILNWLYDLFMSWYKQTDIVDELPDTEGEMMYDEDMMMF